MNWTRTSNREWASECGRYRIAALVNVVGDGYEYAAMRVHTEKRIEGLGMFTGADSQTNACQAKQACIDHMRNTPCK